MHTDDADSGHLLVPLVVMVLLAGLVGGLASWKLAFDSPAPVTHAAATQTATPTETAPPPPDADVVVAVGEDGFDPASVTVSAGETVTWRFDDAAKLHGVVGLSDFAMIINSDYLRTGTYTVTFDRSGVYRYIDSLNPAATGTVTVE